MYSWMGSWDDRQKYFKLSDRVFRPEITFRLPDKDDVVTLVPARQLTKVTLALCGPRYEELYDDSYCPIELIFKSRHGKLWIGPQQVRTMTDLRDNLFLWIGNRLGNASSVSVDVSTVEERDCTSRLERILGHEIFLASERKDDRNLELSAYYRHIRSLCQQLESHVLAGEQLKAMKTYQDLADRFAAYTDDCEQRGLEMGPKICFCFAHATYHASTLTGFSAIGWEAVDLRQWTTGRADISYYSFDEEDDEIVEWKRRALLQLLKLAVSLRVWCAEEYLDTLGEMAVVSSPEHLNDAEKPEWAREFVCEWMKGTFMPKITADQRTPLLWGGYPRMVNMLERFEEDLLRLYGPVKKLEVTSWGQEE